MVQNTQKFDTTPEDVVSDSAISRNDLVDTDGTLMFVLLVKIGNKNNINVTPYFQIIKMVIRIA